MIDINTKLDVLNQLSAETRKYTRMYHYLSQYEIDGRSLERYLFQLERELASMIRQLELDKSKEI